MNSTNRLSRGQRKTRKRGRLTRRLAAVLLAALLLCLCLPGAACAETSVRSGESALTDSVLTADPAGTEEPWEEDTPEDQPATTEDPVETVAETPEDTARNSGLPGWLVWVALGAAALIVGLAVLILRRRPGAKE